MELWGGLDQDTAGVARKGERRPSIVDQQLHLETGGEGGVQRQIYSWEFGRILEVAANPGALQGKPCFGAEEQFWVWVIKGQTVSGTCCSWRPRDS